MNLQELFEQADLMKETIKRVKVLPKRTVIVNATSVPEHILWQMQAIEAGVPQRISIMGVRVVAHSVFN